VLQEEIAYRAFYRLTYTITAAISDTKAVTGVVVVVAVRQFIYYSRYNQLNINYQLPIG